ncbi:MAG: two-component system, OmpR family, response regulator ResD [Clostridiales bacterium]|jgi:DNA-binding response OmpR family regulator|uniref:Stage 0 sporulation protein A homolog n=1 Tax=Fusibacter paucivorans TaxID=76009 RepID=A0ABS5PQ94_9FIRM|nr:response regulator transcription factor [Fusibacter paucivorans]MBS7527338.1 response regulator transcription factor [Fusibacter paucivorans]MDK2868411.1 two-component system, OmpR family, response regulator ResD [Clostridiales bacterium]MDN5298661.1 two-component system, OmpR family, response regulator ResD [Clostridiales bacterium]
MNKKIFIVDDDENIRELISLYLTKEGYVTELYESGEKGLEAFKANAPDLVLLDIMMPGIDGYDTLKEIRKISTVPVIMITAKDETFDKVLGLELGADDYIVKPFEPKELTARVKAVIRRYQTTDKQEIEGVVSVPNLTINMTDYNIVYHGETIELPPKEIELLNYLVTHPNRVFTREQLLDHIWGYDFFGETRTVDVHIKRLREKLDQPENGWEIKTVWGVGYKFKLD